MYGGTRLGPCSGLFAAEVRISHFVSFCELESDGMLVQVECYSVEVSSTRTTTAEKKPVRSGDFLTCIRAHSTKAAKKRETRPGGSCWFSVWDCLFHQCCAVGG